MSATSPSAKASPVRRRIPVGVLGATGAVGQAFVRLLADHPWFDLVSVAASERSAGRSYAEATRWIGDEAMPERAAKLTVAACEPDRVEADVVFSALDSSVAGDAELAFAKAAKMVLSNAKNHRMAPDVPLVIAEVNGSHLSVLETQRRNRGWPSTGGIVTNGNCASIVAALALAPIHQRFGIARVIAVTMQATSGAGYPGVPSLDILGNVIPLIRDEEPKIESEIQKFLGTAESGAIHPADFVVSAHANRVPVEHGHTICMSVLLDEKAPAEAVEGAMAEWRGDVSVRGLPSAPERPLIVTDNPERPQPRRDVYSGKGMSVVAGRVRQDPVFDVKLVAMGHNIIRGAAGASVLNAELLVHCGFVRGA